MIVLPMLDTPHGIVSLQADDYKLDVPTLSDLAIAAYARALDDDERGDIRLAAIELCSRLLKEIGRYG